MTDQTWKKRRLRVRHLGEVALTVLLFAFLAILPVAWASALGGAITRTIGPHLSVSRRGRRNLAMAFPEKTEAEREAILLATWDNLGRTVAEYPHLGRIVKSRTELVGAEHLDVLRTDGQPGICVSAHIGNWELGAATVANTGLILTIIYRAPNNPYVDRLLARFRGRFGPLAAKGSTGARAALATLKTGGHLGLLIDQKMNDGIPVPLFGRPAMTASAVGDLALRYHCPIVSVHVERLPNARFRVIASPPFFLVGSTKATGYQRRADILAGMTDLNARLESWIRARPGDWLWLHKRWPD